MSEKSNKDCKQCEYEKYDGGPLLVSEWFSLGGFAGDACGAVGGMCWSWAECGEGNSRAKRPGQVRGVRYHGCRFTNDAGLLILRLV